MWRCLVGCWGHVGNGWTGLRVVNVPGWGRADVCINMGLCTDGVDEMLKSVFITIGMRWKFNNQQVPQGRHSIA